MTEHGIGAIERAAFIAGYDAARDDWYHDYEEDGPTPAEQAWDRHVQVDLGTFVPAPTRAARIAALLGEDQALTTLTWPG